MKRLKFPYSVGYDKSLLLFHPFSLFPRALLFSGGLSGLINERSRLPDVQRMCPVYLKGMSDPPFSSQANSPAPIFWASL